MLGIIDVSQITDSLYITSKAKVEHVVAVRELDPRLVISIYNPLERSGLSFFNLPNMQKNSEGSVTLYFGPQPPEGLENNWIPMEGKRPLLVVRFYGPTDEYRDKSWELPDVELVD